LDTIEQSPTSNEQNFGDFEFGRQAENHSSGLIPSSEILAMSQTLAQMVHEFNPNYEDKRLT
jgi:hypothetical protein